MSTTRRGVLGAALAAPVLSLFTGTASGAAVTGSLGKISNGWVELRPSPTLLAVVDRLQGAVEAVHPARIVRDASGWTARFPVQSATCESPLDQSRIDPLKVRAAGAMDGGLILRMPNAMGQMTECQGELRDGVLVFTCMFNGSVGTRSLRFGVAEGQLTVADVPMGQPMKVRLSDVPLWATPETMEAYSSAHGTPPFTVDTVLGHGCFEGVYTPPEQ